MLITKLHATNCPATQAALVSASRNLAKQVIAKADCPNELLRYSERLFNLSKQHPAANPLQRDAEKATQKAMSLQSQPEHVAMTVIREGAAFFRRHGKHPNNRILGMRNRHGSWVQVHVKLVERGMGGSSFEWLRAQSKLDLTSEWFVARHARELVSERTLNALDALLASNVSTCHAA